MATTLHEHFLQLPTGPLELCEPTYFDGDRNGQGLEFLGYQFAFDPDVNAFQIGLSQRAHDKLMDGASAANSRIEVAIAADARSGVQFPVWTWTTLRSFAHGYSAVDDIAKELAVYLDDSRRVALALGGATALHLHDRLFAPDDHAARTVIDLVLREHIAPGTRQPWADRVQPPGA